MLNAIDSILEYCNSFLWGYILLFSLLGTHLYLTLLLHVPQRYIFTAMRYYFKSGQKDSGNISQFSSLMVSLAANVGTGNIIGVAVAITTGGPGAVLWCSITGILGMASRCAERLLSTRYRTRNAQGQIVGGPMYALEHGLRCKPLAVLFAVFTAIAAFGIGNITPYCVVWVIAVFIGCIIPKSSIVWNFADLANGLMALPNLICMIGLSPVLIRETRCYLWQHRLDEKDETLEN